MILAEIMMHDIFCVLIFGWDCGFQLWIISLVSTYNKDYLRPEKTTKEKNFYTLQIVMLGFAVFVALYLITKYVRLPIEDYPSSQVATGFVIVNALITFSAMGTFTGIYTQQMEYKYVELHRQADYDQLTGLGNRYYMNDILAEEEKTSDAEGGYSVAMMDIDHFKQVNDTYGHTNGDLVLQDIAQILSSTGTEHVKVCRWGGEEFLIACDRTIAYGQFQGILEEIRQKVEAHVFVLEKDQKIQCTVSIGAETFQVGASVQDTIKKADENLYMAKESGRNRLVC